MTICSTRIPHTHRDIDIMPSAGVRRRAAVADRRGSELWRSGAHPQPLPVLLDILWYLHDGRGYRDLVGRSYVLTEDGFARAGSRDLIDVKTAIDRPQEHAALPYVHADYFCWS